MVCDCYDDANGDGEEGEDGEGGEEAFPGGVDGLGFDYEDADSWHSDKSV